MGDAGEGLVDAEARFQERQAERDAEERRKKAPIAEDPKLTRERQSLRLARVELERQAEATQHPVRQKQIAEALAELDRRINALR